MSTILKALRRLEEDGSTSVTDSGSPDSLPATDPLAADELRDRILAEEFAAQAADVTQHESGRTRRFAMIGTAALFTLALGVGGYMMSTRSSSEQAAARIAATPPATSPPTPVVAEPQAEDPRTEGALAGAVAIQPTEDREVASPIIASPPSVDPAPASTKAPVQPEDEMALAAVAPTPSVLAANSERPIPPAANTATASSRATPQRPPPTQPTTQPTTQRSRPKPTVSTPSPPSVSAPKPAAPVPPSPSPSPLPPPPPPRRASKPPPVTPKAKPAETQPIPETRQVEHHDSPAPTPNFTIVRTSWHPRADRRSAKIRLEETEEILTLKEGDAVGALVIKEISPSAVVFRSGDVEIQRRVGQPGSGG